MVEIKTCKSCKYQDLCKFRDEREKLLNEFNAKILEFFKDTPEWIDLKAFTSKACCKDYKKIPSKHYCGNCKHCISANSTTSRGYEGYKCEIRQDLKVFGFGRAACGDFEE